MKIGKYNLNERVMIIAEIGNNHEGDFSLAKDLIVSAAESGADAVKFQTIVPHKLVSIANQERINQLKRFQFTYDQFRELYEISVKTNITFLSTPFDLESVTFLNEIVPAFKISSGDNNFFPLIKKIAETAKPIIMSTGLSNFKEIKNSADFIKLIWNKKNIKQKLALLHCVSLYPTSIENANLYQIYNLKRISDVVGYSDHTIGIEASIFSVFSGARIIEKHFTIDNNYSNFRDHQLSVNPSNLKNLVKKVRIAEQYLGKFSSDISNEERKSIEGSRRSIVTIKNLKKGHTIEIQDIDWVRPGSGLSVGSENLLIGKKINKNISEGSLISLEDLC
tara:strand:- start:7263 stop:8270 length:1008 start_codon:yes stop_codon:yes gene_type:complete